MAITKSFSKTAKKCKVTFSLPKAAAPDAREVKVVGDFNNWNWQKGIKLKAGKDEFKGQVELSPGQRYEFRYCIDNQYWDNDWNADDYVATPFGVDNSVVDIPPTSSQKTTTKGSTKKTTKTSTANTKMLVGAKRKSKAKLDFTCIEGIGPKINEILSKAGYSTFDELANSKTTDLKKVLSNAGPRYKMHDPKTWAKQAKMAAKGEWTKLQDYKDKLK